MEAPVLGICYGMQLMMAMLGGDVRPAAGREYGPATVHVVAQDSRLLKGLGPDERVWASHGDHVEKAAPGFRTVATSTNAPHAAVENEPATPLRRAVPPRGRAHEARPRGSQELSLRRLRVPGDWTIASFVEEAVADVRRTVGDGRVVCALSGGVDSSVMALLLKRALGSRLICIFVNNGVLRKGEAEQVVRDFQERYDLEVRYADEAQRFLERLEGRRRAGAEAQDHRRVFISVFEEHAKALGDVAFLAQGTIYPDRIESASVKAHRRRSRRITTSAASPRRCA